MQARLVIRGLSRPWEVSVIVAQLNAVAGLLTFSHAFWYNALL